mmetsp:Transcript_18308/g.41868  ORF Transcript_18308/g.41868 Transcript_18308/m.41868 type:complete len:354 (-) Transcript_18308:5318-6379(-)
MRRRTGTSSTTCRGSSFAPRCAASIASPFHISTTVAPGASSSDAIGAARPWTAWEKRRPTISTMLCIPSSAPSRRNRSRPPSGTSTPLPSTTMKKKKNLTKKTTTTTTKTRVWEPTSAPSWPIDPWPPPKHSPASASTAPPTSSASAPDRPAAPWTSPSWPTGPALAVPAPIPPRPGSATRNSSKRPSSTISTHARPGRCASAISSGASAPPSSFSPRRWTGWRWACRSVDRGTTCCTSSSTGSSSTTSTSITISTSNPPRRSPPKSAKSHASVTPSTSPARYSASPSSSLTPTCSSAWETSTPTSSLTDSSTSSLTSDSSPACIATNIGSCARYVLPKTSSTSSTTASTQDP